MTFVPALPLSGLAGWRFLQRTMDTQQAAFSASPSVQRDTDYFLEKIGEVDTAEDLVADRRLMRVALGAFGLQDDINNTYFIRKILEDGTLKDDALANKLSDDRYKAFSSAFGFGDYPTPSTKISDFGPEMVAKFERQQFEVAIGDQDNAMRLALNAERELQDLAESTSSETTKWFRVLGTPPLREVFETAFGLPAAFAQADIEKQVEELSRRAEKILGDDGLGALANAETREKLVQRYLLQDEVQNIQSTFGGSAVLTLLQGAQDFARMNRLY